MRWKIVFLIICCVCFPGVLTVQAQDLLGQINGLRAQQGLPGFSINGALSVAAQSQAQWIVDNQNVSHTRPDGSGPRTRALAAGYPSLQISENIYGGTNASAGDAWVFWLNSGVHYASLVSPNYQEIGIGIVNGANFNAYVLVFGGVGAPPPAPNAAGNGGGGGGNAAAAAAPPPYLGGVDEFGNLKHIVQPGDTLGDIALIYGYTWDDLGYMMQLNGLGNVRDLEVGSTFLVPPHDGTYTPAPGQEAQGQPGQDEQPQAASTEPAPATQAPIATTDPTIAAITAIEATAVAQLTLVPPSITPFVAPTSPAMPTAVSAIATADGNVQPPALDDTAEQRVEVAALPTQGTVRANAATLTPQGSSSTWILIALGVQVIIVVGAGIEFGRRALKKRK